MILLRRLVAVLAMIAVLAVPLSGTAVHRSMPMGNFMGAADALGADDGLNCEACNQLPASSVCPAGPCAILGILTNVVVVIESGRPSFFTVQADLLQQLDLTPPTPPA